MKAGHAVIKSAHSLILNRLHQMQATPYYASAREELGLAESTIVGLEREIARLTKERDEARNDRITLETINGRYVEDAGSYRAQRDALKKELNKARVDYFELIVALTGGILQLGDDPLEMARVTREKCDALQKEKDELLSKWSEASEESALENLKLGNKALALQKDNERLGEALKECTTPDASYRRAEIARAALEAKS